LKIRRLLVKSGGSAARLMTMTIDKSTMNEMSQKTEIKDFLKPVNDSRKLLHS
jgi:hypothetical protein